MEKLGSAQTDNKWFAGVVDKDIWDEDDRVMKKKWEEKEIRSVQPQNYDASRNG